MDTGRVDPLQVPSYTVTRGPCTLRPGTPVVVETVTSRGTLTPPLYSKMDKFSHQGSSPSSSPVPTLRRMWTISHRLGGSRTFGH